MKEKQLIRPKEGRIFFGVSMGLADYFNIDPVIIRVLFVILTIWGGSGLILYIVGIFVIPDEKKDDIKKETNDIKSRKKDISEKIQNDAQVVAHDIKVNIKDKNNSYVFGLIILVVGVILLLSNTFSWFSWDKFWPLAIIAIGILIILSDRKAKI